MQQEMTIPYPWSHGFGTQIISSCETGQIVKNPASVKHLILKQVVL